MRTQFPHIHPRLALAVILLTGVLPTPASSQGSPAKTNCAPAASTAEPATAPDRGSGDGTSPGNSGSTGWTGGSGGAHVGTNPQGAVASSRTWQPPTARGLDLALSPDVSATGC